MSDLQKYIDLHNAEVDAYMAANPGCYRSKMCDAAHYAEDGVFTVEQYEMQEMLNTMSDLAKAAYGTRRACPDTDGLSFKEVSALYDGMLEDLDRATREQEAEQADAVKEFEASVTRTMETGSVDRETAIRWLRDAEQDDQAKFDDDYFCYCNNLPYGYLKEAA